jgi:hypothetical protein
VKNQTANIRREQQGYLQNVLVLSVGCRLQTMQTRKDTVVRRDSKPRKRKEKKKGSKKNPSQRTSHVQNSTQTETFSDIAVHRDVVIDINTGTRQ